MKVDKNIWSDEEWIGKSVVDVCNILGLPDSMDPAEYYSAKFLEGKPSVVMSYDSLKKRWYLSRDGFVLGVVPVME